MTKAEYLRLLRLLSGLESLLLYTDKFRPSVDVNVPDYLLEEMTAMAELLERKILR